MKLSRTFWRYKRNLDVGRVCGRSDIRMKCMIALFMGSVSLWSATREVGSGQPYATIGACITASVNGDVCNVHAGTYTENPSYGSKQITLRNNTGEAPVIKGIVDFGSVTNATLDGLKVTPNVSTSWGIHADGGSGVTVRNCGVNGFTSGAGIYFRNSTSVLVDNCESFNNDVGVELISCHSSNGTYANGCTVSNSYIHDNHTDGMEIHGQYMTISGNRVYDNIATDWANTHPDGIQLLAAPADGYNSAQHVIISNNTIRNHTQNVFSEGQNTLDTQDVWIYNNVIYNTMTTVNGVNMATLGGVNVMIKLSKDVYCYNNYLGDIGKDGTSVHVQSSSAGSIHIKNNIITNSVGNGLYIEDTAAIAGGELDYNLYYITGQSPMVWGSNFFTSLTNFKSAMPTMESHGMSGDPLVNALPTPTLLSGSKAIGGGTNLGSNLLLDKIGIARPNTGAWDIGAYQFSGSSSTALIAPSGLAATAQ